MPPPRECQFQSSFLSDPNRNVPMFAKIEMSPWDTPRRVSPHACRISSAYTDDAKGGLPAASTTLSRPSVRLVLHTLLWPAPSGDARASPQAPAIPARVHDTATGSCRPTARRLAHACLPGLEARSSPSTGTNGSASAPSSPFAPHALLGTPEHDRVGDGQAGDDASPRFAWAPP